MSISAILLLILAFIMYEGVTHSSVSEGASSVYSVACDSVSSIELKTSFYKERMPLAGDSTGFALFYEKDHSAPLLLYDVGFEKADGISYAEHAYPDKRDFLPLPSLQKTSPIAVFTRPRPPYDRNNPPPFINIYLDPADVSASAFTALVDCLSAHQNDIDAALSQLGSHFPERDRTRFPPYILGGVMRGMPSYSDPDYIDFVKAFWGEAQNSIELPAKGSFTLFPGQKAIGAIDGRNIVLSINNKGEAILQSNGKDIIADAEGNTGDPDIVSSNGWSIGKAICAGADFSHCAKQIVSIRTNDDGSNTFAVYVKIGDNIYQ